MLCRLPAAHVRTDFGKHFKGGSGVDTIYSCEIDPCHTNECIPHAGRRIVRIIEAFQLVQYPAVAVGDLCLIELVEFDRLLQTEEMFGAINALQ